jgi:GT2 family glycosyltransferase
MSASAFSIILDFCGGRKTDALVETISAANPRRHIFVLDNASPRKRSRYISYQNARNSYIGGGINDCLELARQNGGRYLMFFTNDIIFTADVNIAAMESIMDSNSDVVQIGASVTNNSTQAKSYPWMIRQNGTTPRVVPHCDLICSMLRLSFIEEFGGFPPSLSGWGYDWELAYQAKSKGYRVLVDDSCCVRHSEYKGELRCEDGRIIDKQLELEAIYNQRYGHYRRLAPQLESQASSVEWCETIKPSTAI